MRIGLFYFPTDYGINISELARAAEDRGETDGAAERAIRSALVQVHQCRTGLVQKLSSFIAGNKHPSFGR